MTIRVLVRGSRVIVETDHPNAEAEHHFVRDDRQLIGAMNHFGIYELEARDSSFLYDAFNKIFKERTGDKYTFY